MTKAAWGDREEKEEKIRGRGDKEGVNEKDRYTRVVTLPHPAENNCNND